MSTKIAPAPPPLIAAGPSSSLPRIAFLPNQQPVLLIPNSYTGKVTLPLRVSPNTERTFFVQPKVPIPTFASTQEDAIRGTREESGIAENLPSAQQRRDILKRKIQERPSKQYLIRKHILLTDPLVEPFVGEKTHQLRKQAVVSNLNRKLKARPGPLDLVTKKILQADAELEEAIKEGRLLFPSSRREVESPSPSIPQAPSPSVLLSTLRISKQESLREEEEARASQAYSTYPDQGMMMDSEEQEDQRGRKYGRVEARSQPHPYARMDPQQPSPSKGRLKGPDSKSGAEYTVIPDNFEAMMKQQELFIEWRTRPSEIESRSHQPHEDGGESDSGETIPYGDDDDSVTYRVFPELPAETPDSTQIIHSKHAPRSGIQQNFRGPIFSLSDIKKTDLMQECRLRGLKCGGDKTTIMMRLDAVKEEIITKFKEEQARLEVTLENSPQISSERALSNTSSSSSPSTIIEEMAFDGNGLARIDESISTRRHSLPSNNPHQGIARSLQPPTRHLSMSTGSHPPVSAATSTINSLSFSQASHLQNGQIERKIQMKTANGEIFYATLPSADDLPIPRDGKPIGCKIAIVNGKPVLQFQQPSGPIETGSVGAAGISDTLLFAQNGSGGQVTLGPQKERTRSNSLNRKPTFSGECNSISSLLRSNSSTTSLPVVVQRTSRTQSTSSTSSTASTRTVPSKSQLALPKEPVTRKPSKSPQQPPPREPSAQPQEAEEIDSSMPGLTDAEQVFAHVQAINKLLDRHGKQTLDAKSVLEHEQALRGQQRIIDQLQKELKKSCTALKMQQQLILSAKRAQSTEIAKMTNNKLKNIGEAWLFELNMKRLNKSNTNFFLTHEQQTAELQNMTEEVKKIQKQHINIQISEASDSAIKDITKFIGANPKTALLIVQLLKKYQNEKNQQATQPTQTFADIPPFEASRTPNSARAQPDPVTASDFAMMTKPGPSTRVEPEAHEQNGNNNVEAIVIDDDSQDEEKAEQPERIKLAAPPVRHRRKEPRGHSIQVDMEEIFRTVLDGSKKGNQPAHGSPSDSNNKQQMDHSPHSVSSIRSSTSMAGIGPSTSSSSPCSSSTPPEMALHQAIRHPSMHYSNGFPSRSVSDPLMEFHAVHAQPFESRPYVRDGVSVASDDNNPTDILMEAVESSGIVDDSSASSNGGGASSDEPMPSSSHSMLHMVSSSSHDGTTTLQMHLHHDDDDVLQLQGDEGAEQQMMGIGSGEMFEDILNDTSLFSDFDDAFQAGCELNLHDVDFDDLLDVLKADRHEKRSPDSKKTSYNGTEELNKILGPCWMNMQASTSHEHQMHPMQLDIPSSSLANSSFELNGSSFDAHSSSFDVNGAPFEDVFPPSSSHVGSSPSTSSLPFPPHSPMMITDMSWLNEEEVRAALSPKGAPFIHESGFDFSPSNIA
ncbi:hypothetical protein PENTCL1PPCAC_29529 [Pristionchus entomophagus]|uniref:SAP domain-containing protein n=1 Tax=Pristionchus entomophagus TaxID=358040 RepID=A0AAV5UJW4_9BILA|nr:hypothetical protein PENTCL1PPCAC_29529 [Pristionchus entomophagus]